MSLCRCAALPLGVEQTVDTLLREVAHRGSSQVEERGGEPVRGGVYYRFSIT